MRRILAIFCLFVLSITVALTAQTPAPPAPRAATKSRVAAPQVPQLAAQQVPQALPVRKVVLYKNGVGYFEHAGSVTGNERVAIDFTSPQLNDV